MPAPEGYKRLSPWKLFLLFLSRPVRRMKYAWSLFRYYHKNPEDKIYETPLLITNKKKGLGHDDDEKPQPKKSQNIHSA